MQRLAPTQPKMGRAQSDVVRRPAKKFCSTLKQCALSDYIAQVFVIDLRPRPAVVDILRGCQLHSFTSPGTGGPSIVSHPDQSGAPVAFPCDRSFLPGAGQSGIAKRALAESMGRAGRP